MKIIYKVIKSIFLNDEDYVKTEANMKLSSKLGGKTFFSRSGR